MVSHDGRVLMKPSKPLTFATLELEGSSRKLLVFGLPGEQMQPSLVALAVFKLPQASGMHALCRFLAFGWT
jgi:molybdopterin biosynthesis enzyme